MGQPMRNSIVFLLFRNFLNRRELILIERDPCSENFEIKYGLSGFEGRNSFLQRKFFRFKMDFELCNLGSQCLI
jgi:hypothetical protein